MLKWRSHDQDKDEIRKRREDRWENDLYSTLMVIITDSHTSHYSC